jgi:hypothetical protein
MDEKDGMSFILGRSGKLILLIPPARTLPAAPREW